MDSLEAMVHISAQISHKTFIQQLTLTLTSTCHQLNKRKYGEVTSTLRELTLNGWAE